MKRILILVLFVALQVSFAVAQKSSLIVLGDLHYDLLGDHDMEWLSSKPGDLRQVTEEYSVNTEENWIDFMSQLRSRAGAVHPPVKCIIQLGDLSEGLAGSEELARRMASNTMKAIEVAGVPVPWILVNMLEYHAAFGDKPYDTIDLTKLLKP
jgi:hypothetical protein